MVHYRDGSSLTYRVNMTDWARPAANGEATLSTMPYGNSPTGRTGFAVRVFQYVIPTDRTKTVVSITLPNGAHTRVLGITGIL